MSFLYSKRYTRFSLFYMLLPLLAYAFFEFIGLGIYLILALIYNWIMLIKKFHNRKITELLELKRYLKDSTTLYKTKAVLGDYIDKRYRAFTYQDFVTLHLKRDGILVCALKTVSFGISYNDINFIVVIDPEHIRYEKKEAAIINIATKYETCDSYLLRVNYADNFIRQLRDFYDGEISYVDYKEYADNIS